MRCEKFNKIGGTEFRVKSLTLGYTQIISFFLKQFDNKNENTIKINEKELNMKFIKFCKEEKIYSYDFDKDKINNRLKMVTKLLRDSNLIYWSSESFIFEKKKLEKFLEKPIDNFFNIFYDNFYFFKKGVDFAKTHKSIDVNFFSLTMLLVEENEDFKEIYEMIERNLNLVLTNLVHKIYKNAELTNLNFCDFSAKFRKPIKNEHIDSIKEVFYIIQNSGFIYPLSIGLLNVHLLPFFTAHKANS